MSILLRLPLLLAGFLAAVVADDLAAVVDFRTVKYSVHATETTDEAEAEFQRTHAIDPEADLTGQTNDNCPPGGNFPTTFMPCSVNHFSFLGGVRNCCPSSGLCADSSCVVFGFPNSAGANCPSIAKGGSKDDCHNIVECNYTHACDPKVDYPIPGFPNCNNLKNHCYGRLICAQPGCAGLAGSGFEDLIDNVCLQDGTSDNYKICGPDTPSASPVASASPTPIPSPVASASPTPIPSPDASVSPSSGASPSPPPDGPFNPNAVSPTSASQSPKLSPSPEASPSPDPCEPCDDNYRTTDCKTVVESHKGWFVVDIPQCTDITEEQWGDLKKDHGCDASAVDGCTTYLCTSYITPEEIDKLTTCEPSIIP